MRIFFLFPQIPFPPHSGGRIVTWNTFKRFAKKAQVSAVCLYHHPKELEALNKIKEYTEDIEVFPAYGKWAPLPMLKSIASRWPYKAHRFFNPAMFHYVQEKIQREKFDIVHAQNFYTAAYLTGKEECTKVHYKENIEGNLLLQLAKYTKNPIFKTLAFLEGQRTKNYELHSCRKFDQVLCISPIDRDHLKKIDPSLTVDHQEPGVDLRDYPYLEEAKIPPRIVFTGTMSYYPNVYGIIHFLRTTWPLVRKQLPELECDIVGANPPPAVRKFHGKEGVNVTGWVEQVQDYIRKAQIYIVPLTMGGGIRLKILEAMASGRAIVSTPIGSEGLQGEDQKHIRIGEIDEPFAQAIVELIEDNKKRTCLRENARRLVEEVYDWDKVIHRQLARYCCLS